MTNIPLNTITATAAIMTRDGELAELHELIKPQMFDLGGGRAVNFNPGGRFHGWIFHRHPDGGWVSTQKLSVINPAEGNPFWGSV